MASRHMPNRGLNCETTPSRTIRPDFDENPAMIRELSEIGVGVVNSQDLQGAKMPRQRHVIDRPPVDSGDCSLGC